MKVIKYSNEVNFRDYQDDDYANITKGFIDMMALVYLAPTGSGKSVVISKYILDAVMAKGKVVFISNRTHLQNQMYGRLKALGLNVQMLNAKNKTAIEADVVLCTIQTAISPTIMNILSSVKFDKIVVDECHRSVTKSYRDVFNVLIEKNPKVNLFGVTATSNRFDMKPLGEIYEGLIPCSKTMGALVQEGYLAKYRVYTTKQEDLEKAIESHGGDFVLESMSKYMRNPRVVKECIDQYEKYAKDRSTIVYCVDKAHTVQLREAYARRGFGKSVIIDDTVSEKQRQIYFDQFESGEINLIFCIETLTEGLDLPNCNCIQLCRPTKSMILYLQMIGRGLRPKEDGGDCIILDCGLNVSRLGMPTSDINWDLSGKRVTKKKSKSKTVVYVDANGKYHFEHPDDAPVAEMKEVDFGELQELSLSLISNAEKSNKKLYMQFYTSFKELCMYIIKKAGYDEADVEFIDDKYDSPENGFVNTIDFNLKNVSDKIDFQFKLEKDRSNNNMISNISPSEVGSYRLAHNDYVTKLKIQGTVGNLANVIVKDYKNITNNIATLRAFWDNEEDIRELKKIQKEAETNKITNDIKFLLERDGEAYVRLHKNLHMSEQNPQLGGVAKYLKIKNQKELLVNNRVVFYSLDDEARLIEVYYAKSVKLDKLMYFLDFGIDIITEPNKLVMSAINEN